MKRSLLLLTVLMGIVTASAQQPSCNYYRYYFRVPYTEGAPNFDKQKVVCPPADSLVYEMQFDFSDDLATAKEPVAVYLHVYDVKTEKRYDTEKLTYYDRSLRSQVSNHDTGVSLFTMRRQFLADESGNVYIFHFHEGENKEAVYDWVDVFQTEADLETINERNNATFKQKLNSFQLKP